MAPVKTTGSFTKIAVGVIACAKAGWAKATRDAATSAAESFLNLNYDHCFELINRLFELTVTPR